MKHSHVRVLMVKDNERKLGQPMGEMHVRCTALLNCKYGFSSGKFGHKQKIMGILIEVFSERKSQLLRRQRERLPRLILTEVIIGSSTPRAWLSTSLVKYSCLLICLLGMLASKSLCIDSMRR